MELKFIFEILVIVCILSTICAVDIDCGTSDDKTICPIIVTSTMEDVAVRLRERDRTLRCVSCETKAMPYAYYDAQKVARLQTIDYSNSHINTVNLERMFTPNALMLFNVSHNEINNLNDTSLFTKADQLLIIDLSHNHINLLSKNVFTRFGKLQSLMLNDNRLIVVPDLQHLVALTHLDLSSNAITTLDASTFPKMLEHTPNLINLYVNKNRLTELHLSYGTKLHTIHAAENQITSAHLMATPSLEVLDLSHNNLSDLMLIGLVELSQLKVDHNNLASIDHVTSVLPANLSTLDLAYNHLNDIDATTFARFKNLQYLNLQQSGLNRIDANTFFGLSSLRTLDISQNNLKNFDLKSLWSQRELTELYLDGNNLTNLEQMNLSSVILPNLKRIGISQNDWHCKDLQHILEQFTMMGIKVHINRPAEGQHVAFIKCVSDEYNMSTSELVFVEVATYPTNHEEYMEKIENIEKSSEVDVERTNKQYFDEFRKQLEEHATKMQQHTSFPVTVAFWLLGIVIVILLIGIVLLFNRKHTDNDRTYKMSALNGV